jgi:mRNA interferase RelE/StbE
VVWTIEYRQPVQKSFQKLDPVIRKRIRHFLEERLVRLDDPKQLAERLQGSGLGHLWRYRVGDYRIICDIQDHRLVVLVVEIGHRSQIYR